MLWMIGLRGALFVETARERPSLSAPSGFVVQSYQSMLRRMTPAFSIILLPFSILNMVGAPSPRSATTIRTVLHRHTRLTETRFPCILHDVLFGPVSFGGLWAPTQATIPLPGSSRTSGG